MAAVQTGDEQFPYSAAAACTHGMISPVPAVEITNDADAFRRRGPDGEQYAIDVVILLAVGAQNTVNVPVFAFSKQVYVEV